MAMPNTEPNETSLNETNMKPIIEHAWNVSQAEASQIQKALSKKVIQNDLFNDIATVAGVDVAYYKESDDLIAAIVILDAKTLNPIETFTVKEKASFPYIPGLFSFRELPPIIKAFEKIQHEPDLIVCDGQGFAHPRRFGLACHLGVIFDLPTIGCGKTKLIGDYTPPEKQRGSKSPLIHEQETIGYALCTQNNVNPVFVSIGHRISPLTACDWILKLSPKYRLPETTRLSDQAVRSAQKITQ